MNPVELDIWIFTSKSKVPYNSLVVKIAPLISLFTSKLYCSYYMIISLKNSLWGWKLLMFTIKKEIWEGLDWFAMVLFSVFWDWFFLYSSNWTRTPDCLALVSWCLDYRCTLPTFFFYCWLGIQLYQL